MYKGPLRLPLMRSGPFTCLSNYTPQSVGPNGGSEGSIRTHMREKTEDNNTAGYDDQSGNSLAAPPQTLHEGVQVEDDPEGEQEPAEQRAPGLPAPRFEEHSSAALGMQCPGTFG